MDEMKHQDRELHSLERVEGRLKVTGRAEYAADYQMEEMSFGVIVTSSVSKGKINSIEASTVLKMPGVIAVISHLNRPHMPGWKQVKDPGSRVEGIEFRPFFNNEIHFNHQPVAIVVADTLERANAGAMALKIKYSSTGGETNIEEVFPHAVQPKRGKDYQRGSDNAGEGIVKISQRYTTPFQIHNPMETHSATVKWVAAQQVLDNNKTQASKLAQTDIAKAFGIKEENIEVNSPFVGGAFGSCSRIWPPEMIALIASKMLGRPVKVVALRNQVFNMVGYRPTSIQDIAISADKDGRLVSIEHFAVGSSSKYEEFTERITDPTKTLYSCPNLSAKYRLAKLDMSTPCWTRAPGECSGSFALESAMDELSYTLQIDPIALRLKNYAEKDEEKNLPWSSNYIKDCYAIGAEKFGWKNRNPLPGKMIRAGWQLGMGISAGIYKADRTAATVSLMIREDGTVVIETSMADVGPGSVTSMTLIAARALQIDPEKVVFHWGNSGLPPAPGQFGSHTTASVGAAVHEAARELQERLKQIAINTDVSPFYNQDDSQMQFENGELHSQGNHLSYSEILKLKGLKELKLTRDSKPGPEKEQFSGNSFCANFVEALVDPLTGVVKISRVVSVVDAGKVVNRKTAESQVYGSIVWGIGIALMEQGLIDHRYGRYVNNNLADYHVPVAADIPEIEVVFVDKPDPILDPVGSKGLGEIALVGFSAAVANAVYHATGIRVRELPITPDKLLR